MAKVYPVTATISQITRKMVDFEKDDEIGIEIECEGGGLCAQMLSHWRVERDGSLRGENLEYILRKPIPRERVPLVLRYLNKKLEDYGSELKMGMRTSVHVHINMLDVSIKHTYNMICLYLLFEELLLHYCGEERAGNLFCLRASDADFMTATLATAASTGQYGILRTDELRYAAMNVSSLFKHGSLEFRALAGTVDADRIQQWVRMLCALKDAGLSYSNPQEIIYDFSMHGDAEKFVRKVFGNEDAKALIVPEVDVGELLYLGMRQAQDVAFAKEWNDDG